MDEDHRFMVNPAVAQQLKAPLICAAALLVATFIGAQIGGEHYTDLVLGAFIVLLAELFRFPQWNDRVALLILLIPVSFAGSRYLVSFRERTEG